MEPVLLFYFHPLIRCYTVLECVKRRLQITSRGILSTCAHHVPRLITRLNGQSCKCEIFSYFSEPCVPLVMAPISGLMTTAAKRNKGANELKSICRSFSLFFRTWALLLCQGHRFHISGSISIQPRLTCSRRSLSGPRPISLTDGVVNTAANLQPASVEQTGASEDSAYRWCFLVCFPSSSGSVT